MMKQNKFPIRVLHVLGALDRGGAETMIMNLYRNIDRNLIQFDFIIHTDKYCDYTEEIIDLGGKIYSVDKFKGINIINYIKQFIIFYKKHPEYKIIHGHMRSTASLYLFIAKLFNRYTVAHSHNISSGKGIKALVKNILQLPIRFIADYYFACSLCAGRWLFGKKIVKSNRFYILKNAIDIERFLYNEDIRKMIRKKFNIDDKYVFGNVARFHDQKNHIFLLKIFNKIKKINKDSILILIGEGELKNEIIKYVNNLGITDSVIILPSVNNVYDYMQAFDAFLFPSKYEGLGIVVIEAQCSSLPVICSDKVPFDVKITKNISFLPLEESEWISKLNSIMQKDRPIVKKQVLYKSGYYIQDTAKYLTNFYLNVYEEVIWKE